MIFNPGLWSRKYLCIIYAVILWFQNKRSTLFAALNEKVLEGNSRDRFAYGYVGRRKHIEENGEIECRVEKYARHPMFLHLFDVDHLGIFPKTVDIAQGRSE